MRLTCFQGCSHTLYWLLRSIFLIGFSLTASVSAFAQTIAQTLPPKVENLTTIPSTVRPGVIETEYKVEFSPNFSGVPVVLSPYEPEQPENSGQISLILNQIIIDGGGTLPQETITQLYSDMIGTEVNLSAVFEIARSITRLYAEDGYPLSLAYVPIQEIEDGKVRIKIIEGYIEEVDISDAPPQARGHLRKIGEKLKSERPLSQASLERYLLLANQLPGLKVTGILEQSSNAGNGVKMTLKTSAKKFTLAAGINNRASTAVGREQFYGRLGANTLLTGTDQFNFTAVQSTDLDELTYFSSSYSTLLNAEGLSLGLIATRSEAAPGIPFLRDLGFETMGWTAGARLTYPLIVRRDKSLTLASTAKWKEFKSAFGVSPNTEDELWTTEFGAVYAYSDRFDGQNKLAVSLTKGWDIFGATQAGSPLASRSGAGGEFITLRADISRNQKLTSWLSALVSIKAQTANNPLLPSEQCGYGGAGIGRGFDPFSISGDRCIVGLLEFQANPSFLRFGKISARPYLAIDAGAVKQIGTLAAGESRTNSLYSFSAGARVSLTKHVSAGLEAALPLKRTSPEADKNMRYFFSIEVRY